MQKQGWCFSNQPQYFNAGFVKPTLCNIFSHILFNVFNQRYQTYSRKEIKNLLYFFTRLFRGGVLRAYKIKTVLFPYAVGLVAATKTLHKRKEKFYHKHRTKILLIQLLTIVIRNTSPATINNLEKKIDTLITQFKPNYLQLQSSQVLPKNLYISDIFKPRN